MSFLGGLARKVGRVGGALGGGIKMLPGAAGLLAGGFGGSARGGQLPPQAAGALGMPGTQTGGLVGRMQRLAAQKKPAVPIPAAPMAQPDGLESFASRMGML